ncbi:MAG: hypothetical protein HKN62_16565, partial [Phycisphaerales bacterium]|nr:hypothetical protein [Phycisphaerales bacterium]
TPHPLILWFAAVATLALVSRWSLEADRPGRCRLDGNRIHPIHQVDLMLDDRVLASFCCVRCGQEWPETPHGSYWRVRDEVTGAPIDATNAYFVESRVVTVPSRGDRIHAFGAWPDAMDHMAQYDGTRLADPLTRRPAVSDKPPPSSP